MTLKYKCKYLNVKVNKLCANSKFLHNCKEKKNLVALIYNVNFHLETKCIWYLHICKFKKCDKLSRLQWIFTSDPQADIINPLRLLEHEML